MKYLRKIAALITAVIMLAAIAIGIGVIFAVRNVNITLLSYSCETDSKEADEKIAEFKANVLKEVRGSVISSVKEESVASALKDDLYVLESLEKVYPSTLNITVRERREVFAVLEDDESYSVYDENGLLLRKVASEEEAYNRVDGAPNTYIEGAETQIDINSVVAVCKIFRDKFSSLRSVAEKVVLSKAQSNLANDNITFYFRCGVKLLVFDYTVMTEEKIAAGYAKFASLSGEQKLGGTIYVVKDDNGQVSSAYNEND